MFHLSVNIFVQNELKHLIVDWRLIKNISTLLPQRNAAKNSTGR